MTDHLGPYELRGELGRGAMAIVWRAFDTRLEREVALKEPMLPAGIDEATVAEMGTRFVREGKAAAGLNHPGIVTIYAADVYDSRPAIVMELIEGETLSDTLSRGALPPGAALAITDQLLDAAGYAHARGVVHRDIKPDNVFVTNDGRVKLADFGIAHVGTTAALTQAGTVMGTPGYMAPEQVTGQSVDARADLFAIGVLAYEMLSGSNPFGATDGVAPTTVMYRIVHEQMPALPPVVLSGLPPHMTAVLATATAKDPGDRFGDAQAFRAALAGGVIPSGSVAGRIVASPAALAPAPSGRPTWLPYAIVGGIGVLVVAGLLVGATSGGGAGAPRVQSGAASEQTSGVTTAGQDASGQGLPQGHPPLDGAGSTSSEPVKIDITTAARTVLVAYVRRTCDRDLEGLLDVYADTISPYYTKRSVDSGQLRSSKEDLLQGTWTKTDIAYEGTPQIQLTGPDTVLITYDKTWDFSRPSGFYRGAIKAELTIRIIDGVARIVGERDLGSPTWTDKG